MPSIQRVPQTAVAAKPHAVTAADVKTAKAAKGAIQEVLKRVRFGQPLPDAKLPKYDARTGLEKAPNGDPLFAVQLSAPPPAGSADFPSSYALVDPKTNEFYAMTGGGITGKTFGHGPLALPANAHFKGTSYTAAEVKALGDAAHVGPKPRLQHFAATVRGASWSYGSGVHMPGHVGVGPSIAATIVLPYIDVKPEWKVSTNEKTHTITVTLDGTSPNKVHPMVATRPQDISIPVSRPKDVGAEYKIVFKNPQGKAMFKTSFKNMLPM